MGDRWVENCVKRGFQDITPLFIKMSWYLSLDLKKEYDLKAAYK